MGFSPPSSPLELESEELSAFLLSAAVAGFEAGTAGGFLETSGSLSEEELELLESGFFAGGFTFTGAFFVSSSSLESSRIKMKNNLSQNPKWST